MNNLQIICGKINELATISNCSVDSPELYQNFITQHLIKLTNSEVEQNQYSFVIIASDEFSKYFRNNQFNANWQKFIDLLVTVLFDYKIYKPVMSTDVPFATTITITGYNIAEQPVVINNVWINDFEGILVGSPSHDRSFLPIITDDCESFAPTGITLHFPSFEIAISKDELLLKIFNSEIENELN